MSLRRAPNIRVAKALAARDKELRRIYAGSDTHQAGLADTNRRTALGRLRWRGRVSRRPFGLAVLSFTPCRKVILIQETANFST
jgi:hypothetical protein